MMSATCSASTRRPRVLTVYWKSWPLGTGGWPICPAAICTFCSRKTRITSPGGQVPRRQLVRIQPHAHAVVLPPEGEDVADAVQPGQRVLKVDSRIIAQVQLVVRGPARHRVVLGVQVDHKKDIRGALLHDD